MKDSAKLNQLAGAEIERLEGMGIDLTPAQIVKLNALGWEVQTPEIRRHLSRGVPVAVGGQYLWPMSLYAQDWFDRVGREFDGVTIQKYALAYAMAKGRESGEPLVEDNEMIREDILDWVSNLRCTDDELIIAINQVLAQEETPEQPPDPSETGGMEMGEFSASLVAACGGDPEFWERRCSAGYTHAVLDALARLKDTSDHPAEYAKKIIAERALGWAAEKIAILHGKQDPPDGWTVENGELIEVPEDG